jgi:hypothetical protein
LQKPKRLRRREAAWALCDEISVERVDAGEGWKRIKALPKLNWNR